MTLGGSFLKPSLAPLNFANVSLMGRLITSGLRELSSENLLKQLRAGIDAAAESASVRPSDVEAVVPMARFEALAHKLDPHQKLAVDAWEDHPVESRRTGDLANLTEEKSLPVVADSLMRLASMANANPELRMALYEMSHVTREWQALVLETGNKLEDDRILSGAYRKRAARRAAVVVLMIAAGIGGVFVWQQGENVRRRVAARVGDANPCAVLTIEPVDLKQATPEQLATIERRKADCEAERVKVAKEKEAREKKEERLRQCASISESVARGKAPPAVTVAPAKQLEFLTRIATAKLDTADLGPEPPTYPCADTDGLPAMKKAFELAVARSSLWLDHEEMCDEAKAALDTHRSEVSAETKEDLAERAEKVAVAALVDKNPPKLRNARRMCGLKRLFGLKTRAFCNAVLK